MEKRVCSGSNFYSLQSMFIVISDFFQVETGLMENKKRLKEEQKKKSSLEEALEVTNYLRDGINDGPTDNEI